MERLLLQCLCIRNDLQEPKANVQEKGLLPSIAFIKIAFFAFHNLCDVNGGVKMYRRGGVKMYCGLGGSLSP